MTNDELSALRAAAMAATPGEWRTGYPEVSYKLPDDRYTFSGWIYDKCSISRAVNYTSDDYPDWNDRIAGSFGDFGEEGGIQRPEDAAYIAAANPATILRLLAHVDALTAQVAERDALLREARDAAEVDLSEPCPPPGAPREWQEIHNGKIELVRAARDAERALQIAVRQNGHDMLMTGEECRAVSAAIDALHRALQADEAIGLYRWLRGER